MEIINMTSPIWFYLGPSHALKQIFHLTPDSLSSEGAGKILLLCSARWEGMEKMSAKAQRLGMSIGLPPWDLCVHRLHRGGHQLGQQVSHGSPMTCGAGLSLLCFYPPGGEARSASGWWQALGDMLLALTGYRVIFSLSVGVKCYSVFGGGRNGPASNTYWWLGA